MNIVNMMPKVKSLQTQHRIRWWHEVTIRFAHHALRACDWSPLMCGWETFFFSFLFSTELEDHDIKHLSKQNEKLSDNCSHALNFDYIAINGCLKRCFQWKCIKRKEGRDNECVCLWYISYENMYYSNVSLTSAPLFLVPGIHFGLKYVCKCNMQSTIPHHYPLSPSDRGIWRHVFQLLFIAQCKERKFIIHLWIIYTIQPVLMSPECNAYRPKPTTIMAWMCQKVQKQVQNVVCWRLATALNWWYSTHKYTHLNGMKGWDEIIAMFMT